jgi:large subunit ribosomal protein L9
MKVLLLADVDSLGWFGDVVEVATGYARNYLLPRRLAAAATEANVKAVEAESRSRAEKRASQRKRLEAAAAALDGTSLVITAKANEQGHLFGSVARSDVADELRRQGKLPPQAPAKGPAVTFEGGQLAVGDEVVRLGEHIKQVGAYPGIEVKFADDLVARIDLTVTAAGDDPSGES